MPTKPQTLARSGYIVTDAILTALAREYVAGAETTDNVRGSFLRILIAHSKRELEAQGTKRVTTDIALAAVKQAHTALYAVVLKAITTPDVAPDEDATAEETRRRTQERNRRTTFARTSKATLQRWIEAGGRLATLDPSTVTKEQLQALYSGARAGPGSPKEKITRLRTTMENQLKEIAADDEEAARELLQEVVMHLQAALEPPKPLTRSRMKRGEVTLTPHNTH